MKFAFHMLSLIAFFLPVVTVSYSLAHRWFPDSPASMRLTAGCVIFSWLLALCFALLMSIGGFSRLAATTLGLGCIGLLRFVAWPLNSVVDSVRNDMAALRHSLRMMIGHTVGVMAVILFSLLTVVLTVRGLVLPLLGWDSLTYHTLKAGLWVQMGGWPMLDAPGGWEYYRSFLGGGEVFQAWTMLFFRSGLFAALPDLCFWLLFGICLASIARECGLSRMLALLVSLAFLSSFEFSRMVGSGYVDTCANAFLLCGLLFVLIARKSQGGHALYIAAGAFGLASAVKVNMFATTLLIAPAATAFLLRGRKLSLRVLFYCGLLFASPILPWLVYNFYLTGCLLGSTPLNITSLKLGEAPPNLLWFLNRPDLKPYQLRSELGALLKALTAYGPCLLLTGFGIPGCWLGLRRRSARHLLGCCLIGATIGLFLSPSFSVVRLGWPEVNGRFLATAVVLPAVMGLEGVAGYKNGYALIAGICAACIVVGFANYLQQVIFGGCRIEKLFLISAVLIVACLCCLGTFPQLRRVTWTRNGIAVMSIVCAFGLVTCESLRNWYRPSAYKECTTLHSFPRYWVPGLQALDVVSQPSIIAFAYGPTQISHGAFLAPFLGESLQHRLVYISPESDGIVRLHGDSYSQTTKPDYRQWVAALEKAEVSYVLCLAPPSIELQWAEDHPDTFTKLAGESRKWGLFRLNTSTSTTERLLRFVHNGHDDMRVHEVTSRNP